MFLYLSEKGIDIRNKTDVLSNFQESIFIIGILRKRIDSITGRAKYSIKQNPQIDFIGCMREAVDEIMMQGDIDDLKNLGKALREDVDNMYKSGLTPEEKRHYEKSSEKTGFIEAMRRGLYCLTSP